MLFHSSPGEPPFCKFRIFYYARREIASRAYIFFQARHNNPVYIREELP